jgi:hypothetical protein
VHNRIPSLAVEGDPEPGSAQLEERALLALPLASCHRPPEEFLGLLLAYGQTKGAHKLEVVGAIVHNLVLHRVDFAHNTPSASLGDELARALDLCSVNRRRWLDEAADNIPGDFVAVLSGARALRWRGSSTHQSHMNRSRLSLRLRPGGSPGSSGMGIGRL